MTPTRKLNHRKRTRGENDETVPNKQSKKSKIVTNKKESSTNETSEKREEKLEKERLARKRRMANETPERRATRLGKKTAARNRRIANETEEEKQKRREKQRLAHQQKIASEVIEKREQRLEKIREARRRRQAKVGGGATNKEREGTSKNCENVVEKELMEGEKRLQKQRSSRKSRADKSSSNPAVREKRRFESMMRRLTMTEEQREMKRKKDYLYYANLTEEQRERKKEMHQRWLKSLTGQKKERHSQSAAKAIKKYQTKRLEKLKEDPEKWEEYRKKLYEYQKKRIENETPEQRQRRIRKDTINHAKRRLKKKLQEQNESPEKIESDVRELGEKMWREFYPEGDVPPPQRKGPRKKGVNEEPSIAETITPEKLTQSVIEMGSVYERTATLELGCPDTPIPSPPSSPPIDTDTVEEEYSQDNITVPTCGKIPCPHCPDKFSSDAQLRCHLLFCHPEKCWKCPKCLELVLSSEELSQHFSTAHINNPKECDKLKAITPPWKFVCIKCPVPVLETFKTREDLFTHVQQRHPGRYWPCEHCQLLKYSRTALTLHHRICRSLNFVQP